MPRTSWKYCGMKMMAPKSAKPMPKLVALATVKARSLISFMGMMGLVARRSAATKLTARTTPATPRPMIVGEDQGSELPPSEQKSTRQVVAPMTSDAPR